MFAFMKKIGLSHQIEVPTFGLASHPRTPDMPELQEKDFWWIFVPDEAKPGHHMSWLMDPAKSSYEAFTAKEDYILHRKYLGLKTVAVPMLASDLKYVNHIKLNGKPMYPPARLKGHLFKIRPEHFYELDEYKENGVVFARRRVNILIPYTTVIDVEDQVKVFEIDEKTKQFKLDPDGNKILKELVLVPGMRTLSAVHRIQAWMYEGISDYWEKMEPVLMPSEPTRARHLGKMPMDFYYNFSSKDYSRDKISRPAIRNGHAEQNDKK